MCNCIREGGNADSVGGGGSAPWQLNPRVGGPGNADSVRGGGSGQH